MCERSRQSNAWTIHGTIQVGEADYLTHLLCPIVGEQQTPEQHEKKQTLSLLYFYRNSSDFLTRSGELLGSYSCFRFNRYMRNRVDDLQPLWVVRWATKQERKVSDLSRITYSARNDRSRLYPSRLNDCSRQRNYANGWTKCKKRSFGTLQSERATRYYTIFLRYYYVILRDIVWYSQNRAILYG